MLDRTQCIAQLETLRDFIRLCASQMKAHQVYMGHGHVSEIEEARQLVLAAVNLPWDSEEWLLDARLLDAEKERALSFIERRVIAREPLPYIIKEAWFMGMPFHVDERVLVPRSPIAQLIETQFSPFLRPGPLDRVLDLCTGSGCIGIACAYAFEEAQVDLADISEDALVVAQQNIERHALEDQVRALHSDVFSGVEGRYDLIVSNPPYVDRDDVASMPAEYHHEPEIALGSGDDGLDLCKQILAQACDYLTEDGLLVVEVGNSEVHLMTQFPEVPFTWVDLPGGGNGIFAITAAELSPHRQLFTAWQGLSGQ
ncbi:MAG: 50S ribosomal protein L3 N(5)-glutamine methyltransferase [Pseudomonadales bacterium]